MRILLPFILLLLLSLSGCESSEVEEGNLDYGYEYYPLAIGNEWIYMVDSTTIFGGGTDNRSTTSFVRERIVDTIDADLGYSSYRLERSFRTVESEPWQITDIWTFSTDAERLYKTEENLRFIKLVFPLTPSSSWDGNRFIDSEKDYPIGADEMDYYRDWEYQVTDVNGEVETSAGIFQEVTVITHRDTDDNFIRKVFSQEKYARGVGMVEKIFEAYEHPDGKQPDVAWIDAATKGRYVRMLLVDSTIN